MARERLLTPSLLRELENVRFAPRTRVEGQHAGRHMSPARGSSTEFRDYRAYAPGDDPARVDWRVYARSDRHVIRTYEQESQTGCAILLDCSASLDYGEPETKFQFATRLAASLAHVVQRSQDQVGLYAFNDTHRAWHAPGGSARHLDNLLHALETLKPQGTANLPDGLRRAEALLRRRCTLVVISDFYTPPADTFAALNPFVHRGLDIHMLHLLHPAERQLPDGAMLAFRDLESGAKLRTDPRAIRDEYRRVLDDHHRAHRQLAIRRGIAYRVVFTEQPVLSALEDLTQ